MANNITTAGNLLQIEFESHITPVVKKKTNKDWLSWGENNNYPSYLLELYKRNPVHGGLIKAKADHIFGKGFCYDSEKLTVAEQAQYEKFLSYANRYEDYNSIFKKITTPFEIFDGFVLQIIYGFDGRIAEVYAQEFAKFRKSPDGKKVIYCDKWVNDDGKPNPSPERHESYKEYDVFNPSIRTGTQILYYKTEVISDTEFGNVYPEPNYLQGCQDIESLIEIINFHYSNLKNGMFAAAMLSLFNGEPTEEEKKKYSKLFERKFNGTSNTGKILFNFVDKNGQKAELTTLTQPDLDKMFEAAGKQCKENIFSAHRTDPVLASVFIDGTSIGENTIYLQKFDRWLKSYIEHRQAQIIEAFKLIGSVNGVDLSHLEVKQKSPASNILPVDASILTQLFSRDELRKHYSQQVGIEIEDETILAEGQPVPEAQVNEHIKKLSGRDWQHIKRLVREVNNGKTSREAAAMMLKNAYALTDQDIEILFKSPEAAFKKFKADDSDYVFELFEKLAIDDTDDPIVSEDFVFEKDGHRIFKKAEAKDHYFFDDVIMSGVLDILMSNPTMNAENLAKLFGVSVTAISLVIATLVTAGLIDNSKNGVLQVTEKGIKKEIPQVETEVYTVYKYVTRPDVPPTETSSRPFCKKMLALTRNGKRWTREALDDLTNTLGEDAWTYRGGFYTNPNTGETTPYCRHVWQAVVKSRVKK